MKKLTHCIQKNPLASCIAVGSIISILLMLPYLILGTDSIIIYHDQLDGELINYILRAKYFFSGTRIYPELLNGLPDTGAVTPAPLFILLYKVFQPFTAFLLTQWIISFIGFLGMYLLLQALTGQHFVPLFVACIFMLLPFYPVYGFCIPGQPLMLFCIIKLYQKEQSQKNLKQASTLVYLGCILLYALGSSLILVGFGYLALLGMMIPFFLIKSMYTKERFPCTIPISFITLLLGYLFCNFDLIRQVLSPSPEELSHKSEIVHNATGFLETTSVVLYPGTDYTETWHWIIFILIPITLSVLLMTKKSKTIGTASCIHSYAKQSVLLLIFITVVILFCGVYNGETITAWKSSLPGAIGSFNLSRITWMLPTTWCLLIGYQCSILVSQSVQASKLSLKQFWYHVCYIVVLALLGLWAITILLHSPLKANLAKLVKGNDYYALDWNKFFACDIYSQIDEAIGLPKEDYRVVSIGIYPAAASYNGFYCLDGYSNNYPLSYKHSFREVIAKELDKSEYLKDYFDNWGNRCYVLCAEYPGYYTFEKKWNPVINQLELNTERLKEMNCKYIFSAAYLNNSEELGLTLLRDEPFETEDSWYHIYVYKLN